MFASNFFRRDMCGITHRANGLHDFACAYEHFYGGKFKSEVYFGTPFICIQVFLHFIQIYTRMLICLRTHMYMCMRIYIKAIIIAALPVMYVDDECLACTCIWARFIQFIRK